MDSSSPENFNDKIWRALTNIWTFAAIGFFIFDFFTGDKYSTASSAISIIYIAILGIYTGTKEFDRWQNAHKSKRRGEIFVFVWTGITIFFFAAIPFSGEKYKMPSEYIAAYIALLSIFALSQRSKFLHNRKEQGREDQKNNSIN